MRALKKHLTTASDPTVGITTRVDAMGAAWHMHGRESDPRNSVAHNAVLGAELLVLGEVARHERIVRAVTEYANSADQLSQHEGVRAWLRDLAAL